MLTRFMYNNVSHVSVQAFRKEVLPELLEHGRLLVQNKAGDVAEFAFRPGREKKALSWFGRQWETFIFWLKKHVLKPVTALGKRYGDFEQLTWSKKNRLFAFNHLHTLMITPLENGRYEVAKIIKKGKKNIAQTLVNAKTDEPITHNLRDLPSQIQQSIMQRKMEQAFSPKMT